jgi:glycine/D-amino acid oxidase-like deaminating enzyme
MILQGRCVAVVGGGFYGCSIALFLARQGAKVTLLELENDLLTRASFNNQARLHGGYHYPRSFHTAYRSRLNFSRFIEEYRPAIVDNFTKIYAIARRNSKVSARQFEGFCRQIGAPLRVAPQRVAALFSPALIEAVYECEEFAFDASILRQQLWSRLKDNGVTIRCGTMVTGIRRIGDSGNEVICSEGPPVLAELVLNCTYSALYNITGVNSAANRLKHEIAELALVELPPPLANLSVTVMDGPFFSFMPFPARKLTTLTHVRYTPRSSWLASENSAQPKDILQACNRESAFGFMVRDAARFIPALADAQFRDTLFEVKTVLVNSEVDDGRPILFERSPINPFVVSILGSKIDNVYDILSAVEEQIHDF